MIFASIACLVSLAAPPLQGTPTLLSRAFTKGEKGKYEFHSAITFESRGGNLDTWIPQDQDVVYQYSYEVTDMKADGICVMRYKRPTLTEIEGETVDSKPKPRVYKVNYDLELNVSPTNEVLSVKDLTPKKPPTKPPKANLLALFKAGGKGRQDIIGDFVNEVRRLALFAGGSLDSSLDFNPKLPYDEVKVGDTWKRTVGYSPQKQSGSNKMAVQRMDYTYTYVGPVEVNGKKFQRVSAAISLKTDLAEFIHQTFDVKSSDTGLKAIPLNFNAKIDFDLDPKTFRTLKANGTSEGGFSIMLIDSPDKAVQEERFKGSVKLKELPN